MTNHLRLMQVHAHPDDEASKGAATTARYAAEGVRCVLVTCTAGEAGDILNAAADTPEVRADLRAERLRELDESARILGYAQVHLLGYRDSGMPGSEANRHPEAFVNAPFEDSVARLVRLIRLERPHVVITYSDEQSRYPHPDHLRVHDISVAAFEAAGDDEQFPDEGPPWQPLKLYYVGFSFGYIKAMHDALVAAGMESPYAERIATVREHADARYTTRLDVGPFVAQRTLALLAHRTQVAPDSSWFAVPDEMRIEAFPWEEYILARSLVATGVAETQTETDLFAGLR